VTTQRLLADVNLYEIAFPAPSSKVVLTFLNMSDGAGIGSLVCTGVIAFAYHTYEGGGLPQYVGEVDRASVTPEAVPALLERLRYGFNGPIDGDQFYHVHIEGGLVIDIVCTEAQLVP
jgi:hypothetical protein